jgi:hypothetical protein
MWTVLGGNGLTSPIDADSGQAGRNVRFRHLLAAFSAHILDAPVLTDDPNGVRRVP